MRKCLAILATLALVGCLNLSVFATGIHPSNPVNEAEYELDTEEHYVPSQNRDNSYNEGEYEDNGEDLGDIVKDVLNGPDYANDLYHTDQFKPSKVDTVGFLKPIINFVSTIITFFCGIFSVMNLIVMVVDVFCISFRSVAIWFSHRSWQWFSDTCVELTGISHQPRTNGQNGGGAAAPPAPAQTGGNGQGGNISSEPFTSKLAYWFSQTFWRNILCGALLVGIATGLIPNLINIGINFIVNGGFMIMDKLKG